MQSKSHMTRRQFLAASAGVALAASIKKDSAAAPAPDSLIAALDLSRSDLAKVQAASARGDIAGARAAFAEHLRARTAPTWFFDPQTPPVISDDRTISVADNALAHTLTSVGIPHAFGPQIDWSYNPTTQPGSPYAPDNEWTWQLSRHAAWQALARAYTATGETKYGLELSRQISDWVETNPRPADVDNGPGSRWRTIECGIRLGFIWPEVYYRMLRHPDVFPDDVLLAMVDCMSRQADYLEEYPTTGNWLFMEANGEFHVGVLFPEFKNAPQWRTSALDRLNRSLATQIYPDGVQFELTPNYHNVTIDNSLGALQLAILNGVSIPPEYLAQMEKMYETDMLAMNPDRRMPPFNDSNYVNSVPHMKDAAGLFPKRDDFLYFATDGAEGALPAQTSHVFTWAGWAVMRSNWERDASFLMFDAGPFGYGHQHEDKLSFELHAHRTRLVYDSGTYAYDASEMRKYVLSARGHNVIHVDGAEQHRGGLDGGPEGRMIYVAKQQAQLDWSSSPEYDYASGSFGAEDVESWGPQRLKTVVHTRRILFVKPDYWIIADTLTPSDNQSRLYASTFHIDAPDVVVDSTTKSVVSQVDSRANLAILPLATPDLEIRIVKGQTEPVMQGWIPDYSRPAAKLPRPVAYYTRKAAGAVHFLYVFAPIAPGEPCPVTAVQPAAVPGTALAATVVHADGSQRVFSLALSGQVRYSGGAKEFQFG